MKEVQNTALLAGIMEAAVDAIVVSDRSGKIVRTNPAAEALFGYGSGELVDRSVNILMPEALAAIHDGFMNHHLSTGEKRIIGLGRDVEGKRKDGSVFPLHLSVGRVEVENATMFVAILHDLSQRQLTQEALARSQRLDAIGQLTGGVAHDFNNLLTVVIGNLELLQMRGLNDRENSLVSDALEAAEMGADLTSRLLVFARKGNLKPVQVDLRDQCRDALAILRRTIGERYKIRTEFAEKVSPVMIDPVQLQAALINLALNARDAMPGGGEFLISVGNVTIDDDYMAQETDITRGDYVRLFVSDNGDGMSLEAQRRAFEPFFSTKTDRGGSGLGLASVYGFVRQSGGHITLYSELGLGTSFGLYFPVLRAADASTDTAPAQREGALPKGSGQTILIVEDNPKVRDLSVARIRDLGYSTLSAGTGDEAYAILTSGNEVDLVFTDLVMPGTLNGYDLAEKIMKERPNIRVLLTSGYASDVVTGASDRTLNRDVLHKPYKQSELAQKLHALLSTSA